MFLAKSTLDVHLPFAFRSSLVRNTTSFGLRPVLETYMRSDKPIKIARDGSRQYLYTYY